MEVAGEDCGREETSSHCERSEWTVEAYIGGERIIYIKSARFLSPPFPPPPPFSQAEVLSSLSHRNIVQFLGAVTQAPNYCLVTGQ